MRRVAGWAAALLAGMAWLYAFWGESGGSLSDDERESLRRRARDRDADVIYADRPDGLRRLHEPSRPISPRDENLGALIELMRKTVVAQGGLGLAAVQIGIPVRVALVQRSADGKTGFQAFVNPEITYLSPEGEFYQESCLSVRSASGVYATYPVRRAKRIDIAYFTERGERKAERLSDLEAAVFQQEWDHLNGKLVSDGH